MASQKNIGVNIKLSIDSADLNEDLGKIQGELSPIKRELADLQKGFKFKVDAADLKRAMELSQKEVNGTVQKVQLLKNKFEELSKMEPSAALAEDMATLRREINHAEAEMKKAIDRAKELNGLQFDQLIGSLNKAGADITKLGKNMTTFVTAPIVALGAAGFKLSSDMTESIGKVDVVFGNSALAIQKWSDTTLKSFGIANMTALDMAAGFGDMTTSMGFSQKQAAEMSKTLVELAGDVASFKNIGLEEVNTALTGIFTGNATSLKRLGVIMTETNLKAYHMKKGMEGVYEELDQTAKTALRYQYVVESLSNAQGDFARTSEQPANQMRMLQESIKQLGATFGQELAPMITPIIKKLNELVSVFSNLDPKTKKMVISIATFVATLGPALLIAGQLNKVISAGVAVTKAITVAHAASAAVKAAEKTATDAATVAQIKLNAAMSANPVGAVITAVTSLIAVLGALGATAALTSETTVKSLKDIRKEFADAEKTIYDTAKASLAELAVVEGLAPEYNRLKGEYTGTKEEKKKLLDIIEKINSVMPDTIEYIIDEQNQLKILTDNINDVIAARKEEIATMAKRERAVAAAKSIAELEEKKTQLEAFIPRVENNTPSDKFGAETASKFWGVAGGDKALDNKRKELEDTISDIAKQQAIIDAYTEAPVTTSTKPSLYSSVYSSNTSSGTTQKTQAELELEAYRTKRSELEYLRDMELITEEQFYNGLDSIRQKHLKNNVDEWRRVDVEIKRFNDKQAEAVKKAAEAAAKEAERLQKERLSNFNKYIDEVVRLAQEAANEQIKSLDKEADAYDRLMAKQNQQKKLTEAQKRLAFEMDEENQADLRKYIARLEKEIKEQEYKDYITDTKTAIQDQMSAVQSLADSAKRQADNQYNTNNTSNEFNLNQVVNAANMSQTQLEQTIANALKKIMYSV